MDGLGQNFMNLCMYLCMQVCKYVYMYMCTDTYRHAYAMQFLARCFSNKEYIIDCRYKGTNMAAMKIFVTVT